jgi:hypothetical protein
MFYITQEENGSKSCLVHHYQLQSQLKGNKATQSSQSLSLPNSTALKLIRLLIKLAESAKVSGSQGDLIGRNFAQWAIVFFGQFF